MRTRKRKISVQLDFEWAEEIRALDAALGKAQRALGKEDDFDSVNELSFLRVKLRRHLPNGGRMETTNAPTNFLTSEVT